MKTENTQSTKYVIESTTDEIYEIAGQSCSQSMRIDNGNYKLVFFVDSEYTDEFESIIDEMDEIISYKEI